MFEDISITSYDSTKTQQIMDGHGLYSVHFTLSSKAPSEWAGIFDKQHDVGWYNKKRKAKAVGINIVVECPLNEMEDHLDIIKSEVAETNKLYRYHLAEKEKEERRKQEATLKERQEIEDAGKHLKFD